MYQMGEGDWEWLSGALEKCWIELMRSWHSRDLRECVLMDDGAGRPWLNQEGRSILEGHLAFGRFDLGIPSCLQATE